MSAFGSFSEKTPVTKKQSEPSDMYSTVSKNQLSRTNTAIPVPSNKPSGKLKGQKSSHSSPLQQTQRLSQRSKASYPSPPPTNPVVSSKVKSLATPAPPTNPIGNLNRNSGVCRKSGVCPKLNQIILNWIYK